MKRYIMALAVLGLAACGGSDSTAPDPGQAAVGSYTLSQVNGTNVPMVYYQNTAGHVDITSGTISLRADHSFTETVNITTVYTSGGSQPTTAVTNGTFSVTGTQVTFTVPAQGTDPAFSYTGAVAAGVVSYTYEGDSFKYQKQ